MYEYVRDVQSTLYGAMYVLDMALILSESSFLFFTFPPYGIRLGVKQEIMAMSGKSLDTGPNNCKILSTVWYILFLFYYCVLLLLLHRSVPFSESPFSLLFPAVQRTLKLRPCALHCVTSMKASKKPTVQREAKSQQRGNNQ